MISKSTLAVLTMLSACGVARAQGYFDFNSIPDLPDQPSVQVDINAALLGLAAAAAGGSDPEIAALLAGIEGVRVRVYARLEDAAEVASFMDDASGRLERDGWHRVVYAQDGEDEVRVYARVAGDLMDGLTIMALCEDEAAFVNVAGRISAEQLGRIAETIAADDVIAGIPEFARSSARREARD